MSTERVEPEPEYLDHAGVAARIGVKRSSTHEYLSSGRMPEPDLVYLGHPLWLVSTIDAWRANYRKRRPSPPVPRRAKIRTEPRPVTRLPRLASPGPAATPKPAPAPNRKLAPAASRETQERPAVSSVDAKIAAQVAAALRVEGCYCTTDDVMELANLAAGVELEHERELLRQRVVAKLRGLRRRVREH